jgi:hypothetical protein
MNASKSGRKNKSVSVSLSVSPQSVKQMAADSDVPWGEAVLGVGAKGPVIFKDKCIKAAEISNNKPGKDIWLYVRQSPEGSVVYSICNQSMEATPDMIRGPAALRWSISQCFPECHEYLGMGHCEARAWPAWRRHILFTFMAHFFILKMRHKFGVKINFPVLPGIAGNAGTDSDGL